MDGGATYFYLAAMAAATAVTVSDQISANKQRQAILEAELRSNELAALDEENQRLLALRFANDDMLTHAGGVDAWASPSLIAARHFNFQMGMEDIENIRHNLTTSRATISARIGILKANSRATLTAGIFEIAGIGAAAYGKWSALKKPPTVPTGGAEGSIATTGVMDLPTPTPGIVHV